MSRPRVIAILFGACVMLLVAALARLTATVATLDRAESHALWKADFEERVRTALWRMETTLTAFIAQERAVPYFAYTAFYSPDTPYSQMTAESADGDRRVPSPLLTAPSRFVRLYFQFLPDGNLSSPQVPADVGLVAPWVTPEQLARVTACLSEFAQHARAEDITARLPPADAPRSPMLEVETTPVDERQQLRGQSGEGPAQMQQAAGLQEYRARKQSYENIAQRAMNAPRADVTVSEGAFHPLWLGDRLLLARLVVVGDQCYVQGCWIDRDALSSALLQQTRDLLPGATLVRADDDPAHDAARRLAGLPLRLAVDEAPPRHSALRPDARLSIAFTWGGALLATVAVGGLLLGAVRLSERRASFVSAVTHELRTPLTTFQLYADMLAGGMVNDEQKQKLYLDTLSTEALRLGHLVENVLAYARLERRSLKSRAEVVDVSRLLDWVRPRLEQRCGQAGMELVVSADDASDARVRTDISATEQVLFNLIDNACKYAGKSSDRRILISARAAGARLVLSVRDFGPGVADLGRRLFQPFHKSARAAAESAPGVGLGLALSRRLARAMGGDVRLARTPAGACFEILLPLAD